MLRVSLASLLFGVAVGNGWSEFPWIIAAVFIGSFFDLLNPYALVAGLVTVAMFAMHGSIYLFLKLPEGEARDRVQGLDVAHVGDFLVLYILGTMYTLVAIPRATANFEQLSRGRSSIVVLNVLAIANIPRSVYLNRPIQAFASSALTIVCLVFLFGIALFPNLVTASNDAGTQLTVYNAASSPARYGRCSSFVSDRPAVRADIHRRGVLDVSRPGGTGRAQLLKCPPVIVKTDTSTQTGSGADPRHC